MKLLIGLSGFIIMMIGVIISIHFDFTVGLLLISLGVFMFWAMLPSTDQNERLRRYERQHQQWLRGKND
jgi:Zn-dependent membrane protease YugP